MPNSIPNVSTKLLKLASFSTAFTFYIVSAEPSAATAAEGGTLGFSLKKIRIRIRVIIPIIAYVSSD